jgi:hypothetical protein
MSDKLPLSTQLCDAISPCPNLSTYYFLRWFWKGTHESKASCEDLHTNVILNPKFSAHELDGINLQAIDDKLAEAAYMCTQPSNLTFKKSDGWIEKSVLIRVPIHRKGGRSAAVDQYVSVPGMSII